MTTAFDHMGEKKNFTKRNEGAKEIAKAGTFKGKETVEKRKLLKIVAKYVALNRFFVGLQSPRGWDKQQ